MKLAKKLISVVSALSIAVTMLSSVVASAADNIDVKLSLTETSTGVYDLAINLDPTNCAAGSRIAGLQLTLSGLDNDKFDMTTLLSATYDEDLEMDVYDNVIFGHERLFEFMNGMPYDAATGEIKYTYAAQKSNQSVAMNGEAMDLITFTGLKLKDGVTTDDIELSLDLFSATMCETYSGTKVAYGTENVKPSVVIDTTNLSATFPGNKTEDPIITEGNGVVEFNGTDEAAWAWKELTGAGTEVTVNLNVKGADAKVTSKTFPLKAVVEGAGSTKVGIIIQYSPVDFPDGVEITSIDWAN